MARRRKQEQEALEDSPLGMLSLVTEVPDEDLPSSSEVSATPDGGIMVSMDDAPEERGGMSDGQRAELLGKFDANLAELLSGNEQINIGQELRQLVEADLEARRDWESRMLDGLEIIGMADIPEDAVVFAGAARVTYPGIAEAMVQFQARAMEELMPPEGPVKAGVIGKSTEQMEERAERVQDYMNYQLTEEDDEYFNETEMLLMALPYAGSAFRKVAPDPVTGRTRSRLVPAKDFIVPYFATSLRTSPRYTHRYTMPENTYRRAVKKGYYIEAEFSPGMTQNENTARELEDKSDDRTESYDPNDTDLELYETTIEWDFGDKLEDPFAKGRGFRLPYVITFEWQTGRAVRIARCWEEQDATCQKDVWYTHFKFLPGFGFYGWGYLHLIGGLGRAASGALRLLLDGSMTASIQGGFKSQDARLSGEMTVEPGVWKDVDMSAEELAKSFYTPPYKEPSPALFQTLEILITGIQRFASTTENVVGDAKNTGPVGTTVALIEQGSKIFSGIHKRIHSAARIEYKLIAKCNYRYMPDEQYPFSVSGASEMENFRADFDPKIIDVVPVSDPNIFSSVQRIALAQAGMQIVDQRPDLFPPQAARKAYRAMLKALRIPGSDDWLTEEIFKRLDPVSENVAFLNGHAVQVFIEQDDEAHLAVHAQLDAELQSMQPEIVEKVLPALRAHQAAHRANSYKKRVEAEVMVLTGGVPLPAYDPNRPEEYEELPPDIEAQIARYAASYVPPPAPPSGEAEQEQADADMAAARDEDRKDMAAAREEERKDATLAADLKRSGVLPDIEPPSSPLSG